MKLKEKHGIFLALMHRQATPFQHNHINPKKEGNASTGYHPYISETVGHPVIGEGGAFRCR